MCDVMLMVDSKGTCAASSAARDAWADANTGLAGSAESDVAASSEMIGDVRQFWDIKIGE